jgi:hypothetical protein
VLSEAGSKIDFNDEHFENAPDSIRRSCEFDSNWIIRRDLQDSKQPKQRISIDFATKMNCNDEQLE